LAAGITTAGWFYYRGYEQQYRPRAGHQLLAAAELTVGKLVMYRKGSP
jgi:hypothetical protein